MDCTFTNTLQQGAILVTKTRKHAATGSGSVPHPGVSFTVNGVTKQTNANGQACFDGLTFGSHNVTETLPSGYVADGLLTKSVTVDNTAKCTDNPYVGETVSFSNTPLTDITVSVNSQVDGGTGSTIDCDAAIDPPFDKVVPAAAPDNGDGSLTLTNKVPGTYICTIEVDP